MILITRRPFLLLEVLIAFFFVVSSFFPLIYPHFYIYQQEKQFINKINIDLMVNNVYAAIMMQLHSNYIPWSALETQQKLPIDEHFWSQFGENISLRGSYDLKIINHKENERYGLYLIELNIYIPQKSSSRTTSKNDLNYTYRIFVSRLFTKQ